MIFYTAIAAPKFFKFIMLLMCRPKKKFSVNHQRNCFNSANLIKAV